MSNEPIPAPPVRPARRRPVLEVPVPHPTRAMFVTGWPVMLLVVLIAFICASLFPTLAGLAWLAIPPVILGSFGVAALKVRGIRLTVTDEVVRVSNGKAGYACDRSHVESAVLVDGIRRRLLAPRTTDLFLLDRRGRSVMLLSSRLWPPAVLQQVIELIAPKTLERVPGPQSLRSLQTRFPAILDSPDGAQRGRSGTQIGLVVALGLVVAICAVLAFLFFFR